MPTQPYRLKDGARVPGVTTIIGARKECGPLMHWAWEQGKAGKDFREERDKAAEAGTIAHWLVEHWIVGSEAPDDNAIGTAFPGTTAEAIGKARISFGAFLEWANQSNLIVTDPECSMVSEVHRFGGTPDGVTIKGRRAMVDWKTSNGVYSEYLIQVAAYGMLWDELHETDPISAGYHLVRFDKTYGDFHHHYWGELDSGRAAFLHMRALYELDKELKARSK